MHEDDLALLGRASEGDETAFNELAARHGDALFRLAFLLVGNVADAEDVLQQTLLGAFRSMKRFKAKASVKTWLSQILVKQAAGHHRSAARRRAVSMEDIGGASTVPHGRSDRPADQTAARLDIAEVLGKLPAEFREVVVLREFEGMTYREIAETLGVPWGTVESRLFRARRQLKELLKDYGE